MKTGDMPDGQMSVRTLPSQQLPGHEGYSTIEITYNFRPGVHVSHKMIMNANLTNSDILLYRMVGGTMFLLFLERATFLTHLKDKRSTQIAHTMQAFVSFSEGDQLRFQILSCYCQVQ